MEFDSLCVHGSGKSYDTTGAVSVPIFQSATFAHLGVQKSTGFDYSRLQNPTREHLEETVANLENGSHALAFTTGMAAISCLMELFSPGDHIIASDDLYGGTHRLFSGISEKNAISFTTLDTGDLQKIEKSIKSETKAIFVETPTNPMMQVTDIAAVSKIAREHNLLLLVDNTFLTPYFQKPLDLGADIVIHSGTKYLGGHNDTLAGFLVTKNAELGERLRYIYKTTGACLSPFDSWLIIRGIKTLPLRLDRQKDNALKVAEYLQSKPQVKAVHYIGLESHRSYEISKKQASGFGAMISFEVETKQHACQILERVKLIKFAESLGGVETLITYPMHQTHADVPVEIREEKGITSRLLRLSVGIEDYRDIINDLDMAIS